LARYVKLRTPNHKEDQYIFDALMQFLLHNSVGDYVQRIRYGRLYDGTHGEVNDEMLVSNVLISVFATYVTRTITQPRQHNLSYAH